MAFIATDIFISWRGWDDIICKFLVYMYRVLRGLSLCTTSMLSVLQAIILSPRSSCLAKLKHKSPHHISCAIIFLSVLYMLISSHILLSITATPNLTMNDFLYVSQSCSLLPLSYLVESINSTLLAIREYFLISLMFLSTWYIVALLCMHRKQTQHLQGTSLSPKTSPEQRATQNILMLMSFFVLMYTLDSIVSYIRSIDDGQIFYCVHIFTAHGYATVSPFLILSTEKRKSTGIKAVLIPLHSGPRSSTPAWCTTVGPKAHLE